MSLQPVFIGYLHTITPLPFLLLNFLVLQYIFPANNREILSAYRQPQNIHIHLT